MQLISKPQEINLKLKRLRFKGYSIGFVPTMGALHQGHMSLIRKSRKENRITVVSIFVNPIQFGPKEDLRRYPRTLNNDLKMCRKEGVDFVFYPSSKDIYPKGYCTYVNVGSLSERLCGKSRPGHFKGVATIVVKLLNIIQPDILYLGQKDAQQAVIINKLVRDLNISVKVKVMPIVREKCGLALSSRNVYLSETDRKEALILYQALKLARLLIKNGARDVKRIKSRLMGLINKRSARVNMDYVEIVDALSLQPLNRIEGNYLIALAAKVGNVRLIDNIQARF